MSSLVWTSGIWCMAKQLRVSLHAGVAPALSQTWRARWWKTDLANKLLEDIRIWVLWWQDLRWVGAYCWSKTYGPSILIPTLLQLRHRIKSESYVSATRLAWRIEDCPTPTPYASLRPLVMVLTWTAGMQGRLGADPCSQNRFCHVQKFIPETLRPIFLAEDCWPQYLRRDWWKWLTYCTIRWDLKITAGWWDAFHFSRAVTVLDSMWQPTYLAHHCKIVLQPTCCKANLPKPCAQHLWRSRFPCEKTCSISFLKMI